jgi:hypothetical protein
MTVPKVFKVFFVLSAAASVSLSMLAPVSLGAATRAVAAPAGAKDIRQAQAALRSLVVAYTAGKPADMEALVSPAMIGYAAIVDGARQASLQKQLRLTLSDLRAQPSADATLVLVQARWEKRFVRLPAGVQVRKSGSAVFTLQRTEDGWKLSGLSGDNPFAAD